MANETKTDIGISDDPTPVTPLQCDRAGVGALTPIMESTYSMEGDETVRSRFPKVSKTLKFDVMKCIIYIIYIYIYIYIIIFNIII